mmetsp:Transcript_10083/g.12735  ORF Transcript_10083/g.12735 Transcript_10083/m.12735 type:complete len:200 (+) Transcript_10083:76-675(+)
MKRNLITLIASVATFASSSTTFMASATETNINTSICGLVISETLSNTEEGSTAMFEERYPVTVTVTATATAGAAATTKEKTRIVSTDNTSCASTDIFSVKMHNGTTKSFQKKIANIDRGYWYGEDGTDGSTLNYMYNTDTGDFITGSLNDLSSGDIVQFRMMMGGGGAGAGTGTGGADGELEEHNLFAFVRHSRDFGAD